MSIACSNGRFDVARYLLRRGVVPVNSMGTSASFGVRARAIHTCTSLADAFADIYLGNVLVP